MPRDSRTRTFRLVAYGIFIGFSTLYVLLIARGIIVSLMHQGAMASAAPPGVTAPAGAAQAPTSVPANR
jgi:hypothetical protein